MKASPRADFCGARVRLARGFNGWTQADLGERIGVTHQYIGYLENGQKLPNELTVEAIAVVTGFDASFFFRPLPDEFRDEECHFRRRAATPVSVRTRVLSHGTLFQMLVRELGTFVRLPADRVPTCRVQSAEEIERAAESCRERFELGRDLPIKNLTRAVERAGVVVTRFEGGTTKIDAFSRHGAPNIVVLNTDKDAPSRTRFDLGHETGHLVMHGGLTTTEAEEKEADRFASALLLPRSGYAREFPRGQRIDWAALFRLKKRWGASASAQVRRAYDLRLIDAAQYQRAYKYIAAQGWLRGEPEELATEEPELIPLSFEETQRSFGVSPTEICRRLAWRAGVFERVAGITIATAPEEPPSEWGGAEVIQLGLFRRPGRSS
jgi:Zn-dependent peptidase ImmA (M78 family)/DNA-binding XRE family transcriptional regulator